MCALAGLEVFRQCRDEDNNQQVFKLNRCPADRTIYIASAKVGFGSIRWNVNRSQCRLGRNVQCWTYHPKIMQCNGRRKCSFNRDVFAQLQCQWRPVNFTDIRYICVDGKSECMFYDSVFLQFYDKRQQVTPYVSGDIYRQHGICCDGPVSAVFLFITSRYCIETTSGKQLTHIRG